MPIATPRPSRWPSVVLAPALLLLVLAACSRSEPAEVPASALQAFRHGVEAYQEEDYSRAARLFEIAASKDDRNAVVYYNLGLTYYMLEAYPEAIDAYQKCLRLDAKFADAHMNLALAYDRTYDLEQANAHYNEYLKQVRALKPRTAEAAGGKQTGAAGAATAPRSSKTTMGGVPLSSLPGGTLAMPKDSNAPQSGQSRSAPGSSTPRGTANDLRRSSPDGVRASRSSTSESPSSGSAQWWTQDTLPKTR